MKISGNQKGFAVFVALVCLLTITLNKINGRFDLGDFTVYYKAASNLISGGPVYMISFETGPDIYYYKYAPVTLYFFFPYLIFNFKIAEIIHFFVLGICYWYVFIVLRRLITDHFFRGPVKHTGWLLSISFIFILIHFSRETYLGNINIVLLLLCCLSIGYFLKGKNIPGGILLGMVILLKPYLLILMIPLVLRRKWKAVWYACLTIAGGLILPFIFPGPMRSVQLYGDWISILRNHGSSYPGMTSIDYLVRYHFWHALPEWAILGILLIVCALVSAFILINVRSEKQGGPAAENAGGDFLFEWFLLLSLLPNLIRTDWILLLFSAPVITFMVFYIATGKKYAWIPPLVILFFFYAANSDDLLGRELSHRILVTGLMGLSNLLLAVVAVVMFLDWKKAIGNRQ